MNDLNVASLNIQMRADVAQLTRDMGQAKQVLKDFEVAAGAAKMALGALGIAASGAGLLAMADGAIKAAAEMYHLSERTGVAVQSLSALRGAAKLTGTDMELVATGLQKLSKNMVAAHDDGGKAAAAFKELGVSVTDSNGHMKTADQVMLDVAKAVKGIEPGVRLTNDMMAIFGKTGANLVPVLIELADKGTLAGKVTTEQARQAKEYEKQMAQMKATVDGYVRTIALDLVPILMKLPGLFKILAEAAAALFLVFVGAPAILALAKTAFDAYAVSVYSGFTTMQIAAVGLNATLLTLGPTWAALAAKFGVFGTVVASTLGVAIAAFAGWKIGEWLSDNFVEAQLAGVAFVDGTLKGWEAIKYGASVAWAVIKDAWATALSGMGGALAGFLKMLAGGLSSLGLDNASAMVLLWATKTREATANTTDLTTKLAALQAGYEADKQSISDITGAMADEAIAHFAAKDAGEKHTRGLRDGAAAATDAAKAFDQLAKSLGETIAQQNLEIQYGTALTAGQRTSIKIMEDMRTGVLQLTDAQAIWIGKALALLLTQEQAIDQSKRNAEALKEMEKAHEDYVASLEKSVASGQAELDKLKEQGAAIGLTTGQVDALTAAKHDTAAASLDLLAADAAAWGGEYQLYAKLAQQQRDMAAQLRANGDKQTAVDAAKKAADEWKKTSDEIDRTLTDALMRAFEAGSGFGKAFVKTIEDMFKTMVLRPIISAIVSPISQTINAALGNGAVQGGASSLLSGAGSSVYSGLGAGVWSAASTAYGATAAASQGAAISSLMAQGASLETAIASTTTTGIATGLGAGIEAGLAAVPVAGWIALAGMAIYSMVGKGGETRSGGLYDNATFLQGPSGGEINGDAPRTAISATTAGINSLLSALGSAATVADFKSGLESSTEGKGFAGAGGTLSTGALFGQGTKDLIINNRRGDMTPEQAAAAFGEELKQATLQALQAANVPGKLGDYLKSLGDIDKLSGGALDTAIAKIQKALTEKQSLEAQVYNLTTSDAQKLIDTRNAERAAIDDSNAALLEQVYALQDQAAATQAAAAAAQAAAQKDQAITNERLGLEGQLLQLRGETAEIRARERAALDESNRALYDQIQAVKDKQAADAAAAQAAADAAQAAKDAAAALAQVASDLAAATDQAWSALQASISKEQTSAQALVGTLQGVFDTLKSGVAQLYGQVTATSQLAAAAGQSFIAIALAKARAGGALPDQASLQGAITSAAGGIDNGTYRTKADQDFARLVLAGQLQQLQDITGPQLTEAQQQVQRLTDILAANQKALDQLRGINSGVLSVTDAVKAFQDALLAERQGTAGGAAASAHAAASSGGFVAGAGAASTYDARTTATGMLIARVGADTAYLVSASGAPITGDFRALVSANLGDPQALYALLHGKLGMTEADIAYGLGQPDGSLVRDYFAKANIPAFAAGTPSFAGGVALVGEQGPELVQLPPSRIYNAGDTRRLTAGSDADLKAQVQQLIAVCTQLVVNTRTSSDIHRQWNNEGIPQARSYANT
jgi:hypothetical protein